MTCSAGISNKDTFSSQVFSTTIDVFIIMSKIVLAVSELPDTLKNAVRQILGANATIEIVSTTEVDTMPGPCFVGNRQVAVGINIETGATQRVDGSYGGNPYALGQQKSGIDDAGTIQLSPKMALVYGEVGGRGKFVKLYVHPSLIDSLALPEAPTLTEDQLCMLWCIKSHKAAYRKEIVGRNGLGAYNKDNSVIMELVAAELAKVNRAGSISLTAKGKAATPDQNPKGIW